ncbi:MAG: hypothetical protein U0821_00180 [Chloroflexota bacterium]
MNEMLLRGATIVATGLSVVLVMHLVMTYRRPRRVSPVVIGAYLGGIPSVALVYLTLVGPVPSPTLAFASVGLGLVLGWWQGAASRVSVDQGTLIAQNASWFLLAWGVAYTISQGASLLAAGAGSRELPSALFLLTTAALWASHLRVLMAARAALTAPGNAARASR